MVSRRGVTDNEGMDFVATRGDDGSAGWCKNADGPGEFGPEYAVLNLAV